MPLKQKFSAAQRSTAEQALQGWGIAYEPQPNGTLLVPGDINIAGKSLTQLPDLSCVVVSGDFICSSNGLTSLIGAPAAVNGLFFCEGNQLTSLAGAPAEVGRSFYCHLNQLSSLEGAPAVIGENLFCNENQLISLTGAPAAIGGTLSCYKNPLTSLAGAPQKFEKLASDFGHFLSWDQIPERLRLSPEARHSLWLDSTNFSKGLNRPMAAPKPFNLKKP
jgi:hypothetical protein